MQNFKNKYWCIKSSRVWISMVVIWCLISVYLSYQEWPMHWHDDKRFYPEAFRNWLFWASWSVPLLLIYSFIGFFKSQTILKRLSFCLFSLFFLIASWARCVEPQLLVLKKTTIVNLPANVQAVKIALVSDLHLGLYYRSWHLNQLVKKLNELPVDAVFFAGDWTYETDLDMVQAYSPLAQIKHRKFGVLGNHDLRKPGPNLELQLRNALMHNGVELIEGKTLDWQGWQVVGIDDLWGGKPEFQVPYLLAPILQEGANRRLVLTHQPDTVEQFKNKAAFLTMAGHTHGGQIQLPWLTEWNLEIFSRNPWYDGLYHLPQTRLFVTTGVGMTGLPARFLTPPRIDLISLEH